MKKVQFSPQYLYLHGIDAKMMMSMFEVFPKDFKITNWGLEPSQNSIFWCIESQEFEEVFLGDKIPAAYLEVNNDSGYIRFKLVDINE